MSVSVRRCVSVAMTACCAVALSAGCGATTSAYGSSAVRHRVAAHVLGIVDAYGLPVDFDFIGCSGPDLRRRITCAGTSTDEPPTTVTATFTPARGCRGILAVDVGKTRLTTRRINPCR